MSCKLCGDTGMRTCPYCKGKRRVTGRRWAQDCNVCFKTGEVTCECQIVPEVVVRLVAIHGKKERVVAEQKVPQGGDWLPAVLVASQQLNDDVSKIIEAHEAWWVEHKEEDSGGA